MNNSSKTKPKKHYSTKAKIFITLGIICAIIASGFLGWIIYAAIVSNSEECTPTNNYCEGIWPFQKEIGCSPENNYCHDYQHYIPTCVEQYSDGRCMPMVAKPIIYLYPETTTEVNVTLGHPDKLTATYPEYNNGWHVIAEPNGNLTELSTNRKLYSLYWEGEQGQFETTDEGFIVKGSEVANFLEEKLPLLGLNAHETEEFIIYWLPILQQNTYNYVRFATPTEIEEYMPLNITPKPDTTIRVLMVAKPLEHPITLHEQILPDTPKRQGFTVVEWGGTK